MFLLCFILNKETKGTHIMQPPQQDAVSFFLIHSSWSYKTNKPRPLGDILGLWLVAVDRGGERSKQTGSSEVRFSVFWTASNPHRGMKPV